MLLAMNTHDSPPNTDADQAAPDGTSPKPEPLQDDLDLGDMQLGDRQGEACSMEEGCERCQ
jgi:hypothetical protein